MKSTSHYAFFLGSRLFSWPPKKQRIVAQSSTKAVHISASLATSHVIWLRKILEDVGERTNILWQQISNYNVKESSFSHLKKTHCNQVPFHSICNWRWKSWLNYSALKKNCWYLHSQRHFQQLRETLKEFKKNALSERMLICNL